MIRYLIAATALLAPVSTLAKSQQDALDARYDRALAAGYKALFLCGAIANAERAGAERTPESVMQWELTGIQEPLNGIVAELPYEIVRAEEGGAQVRHVSVAWAEDMVPRYAVHDSGKGCSLLPIGGEPSPGEAAAWREPHPSAPVVQPKAAALATVLDRGFSPAYGEGARTTAIVVRRGGSTLGERYVEGFGPDTPQRTWSVAKSIAATLIGAAVQRGATSVHAPARIAAWQNPGDPRGAITLDALLRMASGRYSDTPGNRTDPIYFGGATVDEAALPWPLISPPLEQVVTSSVEDDRGNLYVTTKPRGAFRYANNDTLMAVKAIAPTFARHPPAELFARLGMHDTVAETDWQGNYILSSQVWSTARDLAKLGQLYLDGGMLNGERLLPEGWADYVSTPSGPQPEGDFGYGAGFWLFNNSDGVPPDTFAGMGNRGQYVVIVPSRGVVIVRRGEDPPGSGFDIAAFTRDVLAALND